MSTTLSNGYKKPDTGDRGSSWFKDLEDNIVRVNSHKHDGTDGERINVKDLVKASTTLAAENWGSDLGGSTFKQSVTLPAGMIFDDAIMKFIEVGEDNTGYEIHPTVEKTSSNTFDVYVNDNTMTVKIVYG